MCIRDSYTGLAAEADQADATEFAARIVSDDSREAPAVFKYHGYYYLLTSGTDGWNSTAHIYYRSKDMLYGWEAVYKRKRLPLCGSAASCGGSFSFWVYRIRFRSGSRRRGLRTWQGG